MAFNFLDFNGLTTLFNRIKQIFANIAEIKQVEDDTNMYVLNIDYSLLSFDTSEIISSNGTSSLLDVGCLDMMILG